MLCGSLVFVTLLQGCSHLACLTGKVSDDVQPVVVSEPIGPPKAKSQEVKAEEILARETQPCDVEQRIAENRRLIEALRSRGADVRATKRGVVINLPDILFEFDRSALTPEAKRTIGEISDVLLSATHRSLAIEGHTDSIGTVLYNKQLSRQRAYGVSEELAQYGIPEKQMNVRGFGEGSPRFTNNSEKGRARNRRVEIIIENPGTCG